MKAEPRPTKDVKIEPLPPPADLTPDDKEEVRRELRFFEIGKTEGRDKEKRLRGLFAKWLDPVEFPLKKSEENELLNYKIILPMVSPPAPAPVAPQPNDDICDSHEALAKRMERHYRNPDGSNRLSITITKKVVGDWCKLKRLDAGQNPPPGRLPGAGKRYSFKAWIEWFDKYLWHEKKVGLTPAAIQPQDGEEDLTVMEQREKREAIIHRRWERDQKRGEYVHRSIALATGIAAVKRLHLMVKVEDERNHTKLRREKLLEMGVPVELVETFSAWDKEQMRQATDRREIEMESAGIEIPVEKDP